MIYYSQEEFEGFRESTRKDAESRLSNYMDKENFLLLLQLEKIRELTVLEKENLERYQMITREQLLYHNRFVYLRLAELFIFDELSLSDLQYLFIINYKKHLEVEESLLSSQKLIKRFEVTNKAHGFATIIVHLFAILIHGDEQLKDVTQTVKTSRILKEILEGFKAYR